MVEVDELSSENENKLPEDDCCAPSGVHAETAARVNAIEMPFILLETICARKTRHSSFIDKIATSAAPFSAYFSLERMIDIDLVDVLFAFLLELVFDRFRNLCLFFLVAR